MIKQTGNGTTRNQDDEHKGLRRKSYKLPKYYPPSRWHPLLYQTLESSACCAQFGIQGWLKHDSNEFEWILRLGTSQDQGWGHWMMWTTQCRQEDAWYRHTQQRRKRWPAPGQQWDLSTNIRMFGNDSEKRKLLSYVVLLVFPCTCHTYTMWL